METQRLRRRRSRRRARKRQIAWLVAVALGVGVFVWARILILRHDDATILVPAASAPAGPSTARPTTASVGAPVALKAIPTEASRNLVLFIGNGFGTVPMTATRIYAVGEDGELAIDRLPETALVRTSSHNAQSADSAAAMTAYMTGTKVDNGVLSQTTDTHAFDDSGRPHAAHNETTCPTVGNGKRVQTLLEMVKATGRATGIVTTARVTQATAAAAYAHLCHRDGENTIATQLVPGGIGTNNRLGDGIDVILGGGLQHFLPKDDPRGSVRNDARDLLAELRAAGYAVVHRQNELVAAAQAGAQANAQAGAPPIGRLIGLFAKAQMSYDLDRVGSGEPSLAEMTSRAIDLLSRNPVGYVLIVEGGRIGEALDASLARKALQDGRAFDDAIRVALDRIRLGDPDLRNTTVVVTANHDHTLVMNGNATLAERTTETRAGVLGVLRNYNEPAQPALDASGRPFTTLVLATGDRRVRGPRSQAPAPNELALQDRNSRYESALEGTAADIGGGADVPLAAIGAQAARFHGTIDNTLVFTLLKEALGL